MNELFTIVTVCYERKVFTKRYLELSESHGFTTILVDGSANAYDAAMPKNVSYFHLPNVSLMDRLDFAFKIVATPYVLLLADDDFIIPSTLMKCVSFLSENADYTSVQGRVLNFKELHKKSDILYNSYKGFDAPALLDSDSSEQRLKQHMNNYIFTVYSLHKTEVWKRFFTQIYSVLKLHPLFSRFSPSIFELTQSIHSVLSGKNKMFKDVLLIRESVPRPLSEAHEGHLYFNEGVDFNKYLFEFSEVLGSIFTYNDSDYYKILIQAFDDYAHKRRINLRDGILVRQGNSQQVNSLMDESHRHEFEVIDNTIRAYRNNVLVMFKDADIDNLSFCYDQRWVNEIAHKYELIAKQLPDYIIYGSGVHTQTLLETVGVVGNLKGIVDSNDKTWGNKVKGTSFKCTSPNEILSLSTNVIISSQQFEDEIEASIKARYSNKINVIKLYN